MRKNQKWVIFGLKIFWVAVLIGFFGIILGCRAVLAQKREVVIFPPPSPAEWLKIDEKQLSRFELQQWVWNEAVKVGVEPLVVSWIVWHESSWNPLAVGDMDKICLAKNSPNYGKPIRARGIFQITDCYHPEISDDCAFNPVCITPIVLSWIKEGRTEKEFSSFAWRCQWYQDKIYCNSKITEK